MYFSLFLSVCDIPFYSKVMDVVIKADEYMEVPVRRTDGEPLQKLFMSVRSELNLDLKNIKQEQAKFWKQHPALVKVLLLYFSLNTCKFDATIYFQILMSLPSLFRHNC